MFHFDVKMIHETKFIVYETFFYIGLVALFIYLNLIYVTLLVLLY